MGNHPGLPGPRSSDKVGGDARVAVDGVAYEVDPELAGETVVLWWGLFDNELYVEHGDKRSGPYYPVGGPIPLHRYRTHKKTRHEHRPSVSRRWRASWSWHAAVIGGTDASAWEATAPSPDKPVIPFADPDPFQEFTYANAVTAKRAIADYLGMPLAKLAAEQNQAIDAMLAQTMNKRDIIAWARQHLRNTARK